MKVQLSLCVSAESFGQRCVACKDVVETKKIEILRGKKREGVAYLCERCIAEGKALELEIDLGADPVRSKAAKKRIKDSRAMEEAAAERLGGRAQPASGSSRLTGFKGDIRKLGEWRCEHKFTDALKSYTLHLRDLAHIVGIAMEANEHPALILEFRKVGESFAVLPFQLFLEMINEVDKHRRPRRRQ